MVIHYEEALYQVYTPLPHASHCWQCSSMTAYHVGDTVQLLQQDRERERERELHTNICDDSYNDWTVVKFSMSSQTRCTLLSAYRCSVNHGSKLQWHEVHCCSSASEHKLVHTSVIFVNENENENYHKRKKRFC